MKNGNNFIRYALPAIVWGVLIFIESSIPGKKLPSTPYGTDKLVHVAIFFVFCWLSYRALRNSSFSLLSGMSLFLAVVITVLYGFSDEFHQLYVPGRSSDIYDLAADALGGILFIVFAALRHQKKNAG